MRKPCAQCRKPFTAQRSTARYCSSTCRVNAHRGKRAAAEVHAFDETHQAPAVVESSTEGDPQDDDSALILTTHRRHTGPLSEVTHADLTKAERLDTPGGQAALALAWRIDRSYADTGSAVAALVREYRATLEKALEGANVVADPLDELRDRRERKQHAG